MIAMAATAEEVEAGGHSNKDRGGGDSPTNSHGQRREHVRAPTGQQVGHLEGQRCLLDLAKITFSGLQSISI